MTQLHKRFTDDQVKVLLNGYCQGLLERAEIQEMLAIGKTRFFALLKEYRQETLRLSPSATRGIHPIDCRSPYGGCCPARYGASRQPTLYQLPSRPQSG